MLKTQSLLLQNAVDSEVQNSYVTNKIAMGNF